MPETSSVSQPPSIREDATRAAALERRMRGIRRNIVGVANVALEDISDVQADLFEARLTEAKESWREFQVCWAERESLCARLGDTDTFPSESWLQLYDSLREEIVSASGSLLTLQRREARRRTQEHTLAASSTMNSSSAAPSKPQLPRIAIPTFHGDMLKWTHFRDTFISMIHNEPTLTNIEKFHYLVSALKGEAVALISKFPVEEQSYSQAWEKVVSTYDNPRILATLLVQRIVDFQGKPSRNELQRHEAFLTGVADSIQAFAALKLKDPGDFLLATLALRALDADTRRQFELSLQSSKEFPKHGDVIEFVRRRMTALKISQEVSVGPNPISIRKNTTSIRSPRHNSVFLHSTSDARLPPKTKKNHNPSPPIDRKPQQVEVSAAAGQQPVDRCLHCQGGHLVSQCDPFKKLPTTRRVDLVRTWKVCWNCLRIGHRVSTCSSRFCCRNCNKRHHTLIHQDVKASEQATDDTQESNVSSAVEKFTGFGSSSISPAPLDTMVLLGTVRLLIKSQRGDIHEARAVLDSGSQQTFITTSLARRIGAKISPFDGVITSLAQSAVPKLYLKGSTTCAIRPFQGENEFNTTPVVVDRITSELPSRSLPSSILPRLISQPLADHHFGEPGPIDVLIGGDLFPRLLTGAIFPSDVEGLFLQPTVFGLVVSGVAQGMSNPSSCSFFTEATTSVEAQLRAFWEVEEPTPVDRRHPSDVLCEDHFNNTHTRMPDGRYVVRLPFKTENRKVGNNRDAAFRRFYALESRFKKDPVFADKYKQFMDEYFDLGHMSPATIQSPYLIPHHGVWQQRPEGPKLRVVFDASCQSTSNSLNDLLMSGPNLQEDISIVLIRFRLYAVAVCADMVKMYRQILVQSDDRKFQHILWRNDVSQAVQEVELNTVTYGIKPSAFHALRVVRQLIKDEGSEFPLASPRLLNDRYVDDIVSGGDTIEEAQQVICELRALLAKGGFTLSKWASNISGLIPESDTQVTSVPIQDGTDSVKVLGLVWNSTTDSFSYTAEQPPVLNVTKRAMLSTVARIFDPLGLLAPVIFTAKALIQDTWKAKLDWDDELPDCLNVAWKDLMSNWQILSFIAVPRYISQRQARLQLVGFCDASGRGYAAATYLRSEDPEGRVTVSLLKAKTKVNPVHFVAVPRLELCSALLLARLISSLPQSMATHTMCFTDSTTVLDWLKKPAYDLPIFEANRVSQILAIVPLEQWRHVRSQDNPADVASRGCVPERLADNKLWWSGPHWLKSPVPEWFKPCPNAVVMATLSSRPREETYDWTARFSSLRTLIRTVARILRLTSAHSRSSENVESPNSIPSQPISAEEFCEAELRCVRFVQRTYLPKEMFLNGYHLKDFAQLSPFLDERGIVRVGGRLQQSPLDYSSKHPILVPRNSPLAKLIITSIHNDNFHCGPSMTLAALRGKFWIPKALRMIRGQISRCVHCRMQRAKPVAPLMAPLPAGRFDQTRAFAQVGVDYAGPFLIKESTRRNAALGKAYLALFVCLSCKALHLELVSALTTSAFLAALERFIARRGRPGVIWSDHGTNFVGASRYLKEVYQFQRNAESSVASNLAVKGIHWRFIPPRAPHFGGLWEAGVKSVKSLLVNSVGKQPCNFEELATVLVRIEAILNSRPLSPLNEDPEGFNFLTPGHFLIGRPLISSPEPLEGPTSHLPLMSKWIGKQAQIQHVWERWRREYLHTLQQRTKWSKETPALKKGDLVVLIERRSFVGQWPVARVTDTYPGRDGTVRTVSVRTPTGSLLTRAVTSLVPLFLPASQDVD